jgi:glycosyltransferase involved in cell wall biosynthesis
MRVLLPVHHFPPKHSSGAELYTFRLARWLRQQGHEPRVICFDAIDRGSAHWLEEHRDECDGIPVHRLSMDLLHAPQRRIWTFDNPLLEVWFAEDVRRWRPDVVHFQAGYLIGVGPLRAVARARIPSLLTLHDFWFLCPRHTLLRGDGSLCEHVPEDPVECAWCHNYLWTERDRRIQSFSAGVYGAVTRRFMPRAERDTARVRRETMHEALRLPWRVISPSNCLAERMRPMIAPDRLHVLSLGIDVQPFLALRTMPRTQRGPLRIGFVGQIRSHKGCALLIEAFSRVHAGARPIELHVYGNLLDDEYGVQVRRRAAADARVHLHGSFDNADAAAIFTGLDVLVVPSLWYENLPLSILEAYAAGTPVVASQAGGMAELVNHDVDGLVFPLGDADGLRVQLQRLCDEPNLVARLQAGARGRPPSAIDDEMRTLFAWYEEAAASMPPSSSNI